MRDQGTARNAVGRETVRRRWHDGSMTHLGAALVFVLAGMASAADVAPIGRIDVDMSDRLPVARRERWERAGGQTALARALDSELRRRGRLDSTGTARLTVTLDGYRMRPGTSPPWMVYGLIPPYRVDHLADGDAVELVVTLHDGDRIVDRFSITAERPDTAGPRDATSRATRLAGAAAHRIAAVLEARSGGG